MPEKIKIMFRTRWPIRQVSETEFQVDIPMADGGTPLISERAAELYRLSESEYAAANEAALRAVAIIS